MRILHRIAADSRGASAAEYALLLAIVGGTLAIASGSLGKSVACTLDRSAAVIANAKPGGNPNYGNSDPNGNAYGQRRNC